MFVPGLPRQGTPTKKSPRPANVVPMNMEPQAVYELHPQPHAPGTHTHINDPAFLLHGGHAHPIPSHYDAHGYPLDHSSHPNAHMGMGMGGMHMPTAAAMPFNHMDPHGHGHMGSYHHPGGMIPPVVPSAFGMPMPIGPYAGGMFGMQGQGGFHGVQGLQGMMGNSPTNTGSVSHQLLPPAAGATEVPAAHVPAASVEPSIEKKVTVDAVDAVDAETHARYEHKKEIEEKKKELAFQEMSKELREELRTIRDKYETIVKFDASIHITIEEHRRKLKEKQDECDHYIDSKLYEKQKNFDREISEAKYDNKKNEENYITSMDQYKATVSKLDEECLRIENIIKLNTNEMNELKINFDKEKHELNDLNIESLSRSEELRINELS